MKKYFQNPTYFLETPPPPIHISWSWKIANMGAEQSSGRHSGGQNDELVKRCYYEVLGVERFATEDEIKKAYRRKALELHPDRNYGNVESATTLFAEVSSAYEILSDPQERAWYDSHRDSILRGSSGNGGEEDKFEHNMRMTSANDIVNLMSRFNPRTPFTDAPNGFYGILQQTFGNLKREEEKAAEWEGVEVVDYPEFGSKEDGYEDVVRPFYRTWINFSTKKSFSWRDAYRASDAPDRATRRLIEKENKRLREEGIREFNDAVRALVAFVRKRDRRYIPNSQTEADRQKILRDAAIAQAAKSRAANQAKFEQHVVPDWAKTREPDHDNVGGFSDSEEEVVEEIECVVCGKTFKSEKQFETHERSKKHVKAVQELQREMRRENEALNLDKSSAEDEDDLASDLDELDTHDQEEPLVEPSTAPESVDEIKASIPDAKDENQPPSSGKTPLDASSSSSDQGDDEYAPRKTVESRLANSLLPEDVDSTPAASDGDAGQKVGKAKLKRAKRAAKQEQFVQESQEAQVKCTTCSESFPSKTKLFAHIEKFPKHAQLVSKSGAKQGKGKKKM